MPAAKLLRGRFRTTCYRAHDPRWSFAPLSGTGAARYGGRYNLEGTPALYLSLEITTAIREIAQGLAYKLDPCVLCPYEVDCSPIAELRTDAGRKCHRARLSDMACASFADRMAGREPASWRLAERLRQAGCAGSLTPSFAPRATARDHNLVLWSWGADLPTRVTVNDPSGRLLANQLSWPT
jgi:RES domain-containing protein